MSDQWTEMDEWCAARIERLTAKAGEHVMAGRSLEQPRYRMMLGEHRAYSAMRSFISGARKAAQ